MDHWRYDKYIKPFIILIRVGVGLFLTLMAQQKHAEVNFYLGLPSQIADFMSAMQSARLYWQFIGVSQILIAALLISQRFATLGAVILMPMVLNVLFITIALDFGATVYLNTGLLILTLILLIYDYPKLLPVLGIVNSYKTVRHEGKISGGIILAGIVAAIAGECLSYAFNPEIRFVGYALFAFSLPFYFFRRKAECSIAERRI